jgi:S1-C subfamily serine protease
MQGNNKLIMLGFLICFVILGSSTFLYIQLSNDYNTKFLATNTKIDLISSAVQQETEKSARELALLEDQTLTNFKTLETTLRSENTKVKLDLESQLSSAAKKLEQSNQDLENKISGIKVGSSDFSAIAEDVVKAVVSIRTNKARGSGVIFDGDGYVMTNRHVIEDASSVVVVDYNENVYLADVLALATNADLAVLKIRSEQRFNALSFAKESEIKVGAKVIAVGNPLGLSFTVTEGIISSSNRIIEGISYVQTDVPINPGNSGGPLVNAQKKIVGINTFKLSNSEGLGFAVSAVVAKDMADDSLR